MDNNLKRQIKDDVFDLDTGGYGYAQLYDMYEDIDGLLSDDEVAEICQDLGMRDGEKKRKLILIGYLLGVASVEDEDE